MLENIRVRNLSRDDLPMLELPMFNPDRFPIAFIDGLDPGAAELFSTPYANIDGDFYQHSRVTPRNIVMTLELGGSGYYQEPEVLRSELRRYFSPGIKVGLLFETTLVTRYISGVVEGFEAPLFVQDPMVQISIICHDPFFYAEEFKQLTFASVAASAPISLINEGDVPIGMIVGAQLRGIPTGAGVPTSFLLKLNQDEMRGTQNVGTLQWIRVGTDPIDRFITWENTSILDKLTTWTWPLLKPGENVFQYTRYNASGASPAYTDTFEFEYRERFTGL